MGNNMYMFLGYEPNNFTMENGTEVKGYTLYVARNINTEAGGYGVKPSYKYDRQNKKSRNLYVSASVFESEHFDSLNVGDQIELICNFEGKIRGFALPS